MAEARAVYDLIVQGKAQLVGDLALLKETIDLLQDEPFTNVNQLPDGSYS